MSTAVSSRLAYPLLVLFAGMFACTPVVAADQRSAIPLTQFLHRTWLREQGLPQNSVNVIIQSRSGYLWIGTQEGLARFDGIHFTIFNRRTLPELGSNYIWSLFEDRTGALWIGTNGGGVTRLLDGIAKTFTVEHGLPGNIVWTIAEDSSGSLMVGTEDGLAVFASNASDDSHKPFTPVFQQKGIAVRSILPLSTNEVLLGTTKGLYRLRDGQPTLIHSMPDVGAIVARSILFQGTSRILVASMRSCSFLEKSTLVPFDIPSALLHTIIFDVQQDERGGLWFASGGAGIWRYADGKWSSFTSTDGLPDDQVRSLFIDHEGTVWAGTYGGGLNALRESRFSTVSRREGLTNEFVLSLCEDPSGQMRIGTYGGGMFRWNGSTAERMRNDLPTIVTSLLAATDGTLYIGSPNEPLKIIRRDGSVGSIAGSTRSYSVTALYEDRQGRTWSGSLKGVLALRGGRIVLPSPPDELSFGPVIAIVETRDSSLWFGTEGNGLFRFERGVLHRYTINDGLPSNSITALFADADGTLWIGTDGAGLVRRAGGRFSTVTSANGLFDDVIYSILEDANNVLWMSSNNGIFCAKKSELLRALLDSTYYVQNRSFGISDGMRSSECNGRRQPSAWNDSQGRLWFSTLKGAVVVDPHRLSLNPTSPPVVIEHLATEDTVFAASPGIVLPAHTSRLSIDYTALSFVAPERNQFRFRLIGYDHDWVDAKNSHTAHYTNLSPGEYEFRVVARNNDGVWNETGSSLTFVLAPHYYETSVFFTVMIIVAGILVFLLYRWRSRMHHRREMVLVDLVEKRTKSLIEEKERVEQTLHDAQVARATAEQQTEIAEEATKLKSRLLHLAAHDLKSPLISIRGFNQIIRNDSLKDAKLTGILEMSDLIHSLTVNMISLINQLLNAEAIESGQLTLIRKRVEVCNLTREIIGTNMMFAANKGQTLRFDPSPGTSCIVEGDESRLRDALDNLVTNAIKYSPNGSPIDITVRRDQGNVLFSVQDYGPGLTDEDKSKIFGKFQRLSAQPTGRESTTGLGLSITKEIVDLHKGKIHIESIHGNGSTFTIELPGDER